MHSLLKYPILCHVSSVVPLSMHFETAMYMYHILPAHNCLRIRELVNEYFKYDPEVTDLIMENQKFHVAKAVFIDVSSVFGKMFAGKFKEKKTSELELPGKKHSSFELFLRCMFLRR